MSRASRLTILEERLNGSSLGSETIRPLSANLHFDAASAGDSRHKDRVIATYLAPTTLHPGAVVQTIASQPACQSSDSARSMRPIVPQSRGVEPLHDRPGTDWGGDRSLDRDAGLPKLTTMPDESTPEPAPDIVSRYFEADKGRDIEATLSLFRDDAIVIDEGRAWRGSAEIRQWRLGPASTYEYTTTLASIDHTDDTHYRVSGRIDGNFPGATAELIWDFSTVGGLISCLKIAPP